MVKSDRAQRIPTEFKDVVWLGMLTNIKRVLGVFVVIIELEQFIRGEKNTFESPVVRYFLIL